MSQARILIEGIQEINSTLATTASQLHALLGDDKSGTSYSDSFSLVSNNSDVTDVLDSIAKRVRHWPAATALRYSERDYQRRRAIVLVAATIPQVATRLYQYAREFLKKPTGFAVNWFSKLNEKVNNNLNHNEFATLGNKFCKAFIDAQAYNVATRRGTLVSNDLLASADYTQALGMISDIYQPILRMVADILSAMKLNKVVPPEMVEAAAHVVMAYNLTYNFFYGTENSTAPWYDPNESADKMMSHYIQHKGWMTGSSTESTEEAKQLIDELTSANNDAGEDDGAYDDVDDFRRRKEREKLELAKRKQIQKLAKSLDKSKKNKKELEQKRREMGLETLDSESADIGDSSYDTRKKNVNDDMIVKDMTHFGENTAQENFVGPKTKFTCGSYYPLFAVDGLTQYADTEYRIPMQRLATILLKEAGYHNISTGMSYESFTEMVNQFFKVVSENTENAVALHTNICEAYDSMNKSQKTELKAAICHSDPNNMTAKKTKLAEETINAFFDTVVYKGSFRLSGRTLLGGSINAGYLLQPVFSFGENSTNDRNETLGLTSPGIDVSKMFHTGETSVELSYKASENDNDTITGISTQRVVDTIPFTQIRDIYKDYVSSSLVPVIASRKGLSWVAIKGIFAYAKASLGTLDDVRENQSFVDQLSDLYYGYRDDTRIPASRKVSQSLSSDPTLNTRLLNYNFVSSDAITNTSAKLDLCKSIYDKYHDTDLPKSITALKSVCSKFTSSMTEFAENAKSHSPLVSFDVAKKKANAAEPSISELVSIYTKAGEPEDTDTAIHRSIPYLDEYILKYIQEFKSGNSATTSTDDIVIASQIRDFVSAYDGLNDLKGSASPMHLAKLLIRYVYVADKMAGQNASVVPPNFATIRDNVMELHKNILDVTKKKRNTESMYDAMEQIAVTNQDALHQYADYLTTDEISTAVDTMRKQRKELMRTATDDALNGVNSDYLGYVSDECIKDLRRALVNTIAEIVKQHMTTDRLTDTLQAIATTMDGDASGNYEELVAMKPGQLAIPVHTMGELYGFGESIATGVDNKVYADDILVDDMPDSQEPMGELDPYGAANSKNAALNTMLAGDDATVNGASSENELIGNPPNDLEYIIDAYSNYVGETERREDLIKSANALFNITKRLTGLSFDGMNFTKPLWVRKARQTGKVAPTILDRAEKVIEMLSVNEEQIASAEHQLEDSKSEYPYYRHLIGAMQSGGVSVSELNAIMPIYDAAKAVLSDLQKYSIDGKSTKLYAYTENDFTAISQLVYIIGSHLLTPNDDSKEDLLDVLYRVKDAIDQYGNPLSVKIVNSVIDAIRNTSSADLPMAEVQFINRAGNILQANTSGRNKALVDRTGSIRLPAGGNPGPNQMDVGAGLDAYARTMLRPRTDTDTTKATGRANKEEKEARQSYIDIVRDDMNRHPELAKYAFALGSLLDAFDRTVTDERVSEANRENRKYNSVGESMSEVSLEGNLSDNDLQRELINAIMDDERAGNKDYPTVRSVVDAAMNGTPVKCYGLEYGKTIGSRANIVNNTRNKEVCFSSNGKHASVGQPLSVDEIGHLAVGNTGVRFAFSDPNNIVDLVRAVRMAVFKKIAARIGDIDDEGNVKLNRTQNAYAETAVRSLYKMCADLDTPISSIMVANTNLGYKLGRDASVDYARKTLSDNGELDFDSVSRVAGENDVFPVNYSDEKSSSDVEWIDSVTSILGSIPENLTERDVDTAVDLYCGSRVDQGELASNQKLRPMYLIIKHMTDLDTSTGVPMGFWGNDLTKIKDRIRSIFNLILSHNMSGKTWKERAELLRERFMAARETGSTQLALYGQYEPKVGTKVVKPSEATLKQIAHRRINPYYAVNMHKESSTEYMSTIEELKSAGYITSMTANTVRTKYAGLKFDANTFRYIIQMTIDIFSQYGSYINIPKAFDIAVMCYVSGVRLDSYQVLAKRLYDISRKANYNDSVKKAASNLLGSAVTSDTINTPFTDISIGSAICVIAKSYSDKLVDGIKKAGAAFATAMETVDAKRIDGMVKTSLGWFTSDAFDLMCLGAVADHCSIEDEIKSLTGHNVTRGIDLTAVTHEPSAEFLRPEEPEEEVVKTPDPKPVKEKGKKSASKVDKAVAEKTAPTDNKPVAKNPVPKAEKPVAQQPAKPKRLTKAEIAANNRSMLSDLLEKEFGDTDDLGTEDPSGVGQEITA